MRSDEEAVRAFTLNIWAEYEVGKVIALFLSSFRIL